MPAALGPDIRALIVDSAGAAASIGGGTQYADGAAAATPTGTAVAWNDVGTERIVSAAKPLPVGGAKTNNNAAPGATNIGTLPAIANAAAPTWVEANQVGLSVDLAGNLRVLGAGSLTNNNAAPGATNQGVLSAIANAADPAWTEGRQVLASVTLAGYQRVTGTVQGTTAAGAAAPNPVGVGFLGTGATLRNASGANQVTATTGNDVLGVGPLVYSTTGPTWDRMRDASSVNGTGGTGLLGVGLLGFDATNYRRLLTDVTGLLRLGTIETSIVPGTGATHLGKAEDAGHTSGDTGVFMLAVRQDTQSALAGTTLDYIPFITDANGSLRGVVGSYQDTIVSTLTRAANTTIYTAGDEMTDTGGTIRTLTACARFSGGTGAITHWSVNFSDNWTVKPQIEIWVWDTTRTPAADNGVFAPADADMLTLVGIIPLTASFVGDATAGTGNMAMDSGPVNLPFKTVGSANLFYEMVIRNAAQAGANSSVVTSRVHVTQD